MAIRDVNCKGRITIEYCVEAAASGTGFGGEDAVGKSVEVGSDAAGTEK